MGVSYSHESQLSRRRPPIMTAPTSTGTSRTVTFRSGLTIDIQEFGSNTGGTGVLVLHGGAGPRTMAGISAALSQHVYVVTPTHPGFDGTPRLNGFDSVGDLAE